MAGAKILVVDDDVDLRAVIQEALERAGYFVLDAPNGQQALGVLERLDVDLVLIDVNMPVMSGPQFVAELARRGNVRPFGIITMSGSIHPQSSPTEWFLPKPFELGLLLSLVADFCGRRALSPFWIREQLAEGLGGLTLRLPPREPRLPRRAAI